MRKSQPLAWNLRQQATGASGAVEMQTVGENSGPTRTSPEGCGIIGPGER